MTRGEINMRLVAAVAAFGAASACGSGQTERQGEAGSRGSEVTVIIPPPAQEPQFEVRGPAGIPVKVQLLDPVPVDGADDWASVLRRVGYPCDRITALRQLQQEGEGPLEIYRVECADGGPYQASRREGRIKFRRWTGEPFV